MPQSVFAIKPVNFWRPALYALLCLLLSLQSWQLCSAATLTLAVVGIDADARYQPRRLEHNYPGHPQGRVLDAVRVAQEESSPELTAVGHTLQVKSITVPGPAQWPLLIVRIKEAHAQYVVLDMSGEDVAAFVQQAQAALPGVLFFNVTAGEDVLRGSACFSALLHTFPSVAMQYDALAQYLAARSWTQALVLVGPTPQDQILRDAFARSARRYGVKVVKQAPFKLSADPRERDLGNIRLLTNERTYDAVVVIDSDGEFARSVPYNTQLPRPVLGSSGLVAEAWHVQWDSNGGPQLSRRFFKSAHRPMTTQDWAAWVAVKSIVSVLAEHPAASPTEQLRALRSGTIYMDGFKGPRLSYRPWDGQLRQPVFLAHADGVAAVAPFEGVMHPVEVLDTLGVDEKESTCRQRP